MKTAHDKHFEQSQKAIMSYLYEKKTEEEAMKYKMEVEIVAENEEKEINKYLIPAERCRIMDSKVSVMIFRIGNQKSIYCLSMVKHNRKNETAILKWTIKAKEKIEEQKK